MIRNTVTITTLDNPEPRQFHIEQAKAERFAAKIRADGGTAIVSTLGIGAALAARLLNSGVNPNSIR